MQNVRIETNHLDLQSDQSVLDQNLLNVTETEIETAEMTRKADTDSAERSMDFPES